MLKTSTKISLKFTIFTVVILSIFGIIINTIFFVSWHNKANLDLRKKIETIEGRPNIVEKIIEQRFSRSFMFPKWSKESTIIKDNIKYKNIAKLEDYYIVFIEGKEQIFVMNVTPQMDWQDSLLKLMFRLTIILSVIAYLISILFVKTSLKKLNELVAHTKNININKLDKINMEGSPNDEIKIVADSLDKSLSKIAEQTNALKDFVSNVSHEFKTPLMVINSDIDYSIKSKEYEKWLQNIKKTAKELNELIEHLNFITRLEDIWNLELKEENCSNIINEIIEKIETNNQEKKIIINKNIQENVHWKIHKSSFEMIVKNLLWNAFKYTPVQGTIEISLNENTLSIKDNGVWIDSENIGKIWERFWKEDSSRTEKKSYWLGLYLVKKLVNKHNWTITAKSEKLLWSLFIIER